MTNSKKCIKIIAEIIVELEQEGMLKEKLTYFHQNQVFCFGIKYAKKK